MGCPHELLESPLAIRLRKLPRHLLDAIRELARFHPDAKLLVVSHGDMVRDPNALP
jgi:hypothetical protein